MDEFEAQQPATRGDLDKVAGNLDKVIIDVAGLQDSVKEIKEEIKHLPTKEEFFSSQGKLMVEVKAVRQEQSAIVQLIRRHDERITKLEGRTGIGSVAVA